MSSVVGLFLMLFFSAVDERESSSSVKYFMAI